MQITRLFIILTALFLAACSDLMSEQKPYDLGANGSGGAGASGRVPPPPDMSGLMNQISSANHGMIQDCVGRPIANNFLIAAVRALQQLDSRWGFMIKDGGGRIPRDILAYASTNEREGSHNFYVIDFVMSGCGNTPGASDFSLPATQAAVGWILLNGNTGYADNRVWSANP